MSAVVEEAAKKESQSDARKAVRRKKGQGPSKNAPSRTPDLKAPQRSIKEANENTHAIVEVVSGTGAASTETAVIEAALDSIRSCFGWAYGSFWTLDPALNALVFVKESGSVNEEFRRVTLQARSREGEGLSGRVWKNRDLMFTRDIGSITDCCRAPAAKRAGVRSGVCFPIVIDGKVEGTMDFFATEYLSLSPERMGALRNTASLVTAAIERIRNAERSGELAENAEAVNEVLEVVNNAETVEAAIRAALDKSGKLSATAAGPHCPESRG